MLQNASQCYKMHLTFVNPTGFDDESDEPTMLNPGDEQSTVDVAASNSNTTWTGSRLPGGGDAPPELTYSFGPGHYGMDSGNESNYLGKSNQQVQIPNPGVATHSVINPDGMVAPLYDEGQLQNGTDQLNDTLIEAPGHHRVGVNGVELGFNYAAFGAAIAPYNPLVAARQTMELGISGVPIWRLRWEPE